MSRLSRVSDVVKKNPRLTAIASFCGVFLVVVGLVVGLVSASQSSSPVTDEQVEQYEKMMEKIAWDAEVEGDTDNEFVLGRNACIVHESLDLLDRIRGAQVTPDRDMGNEKNVKFLIHQIPTRCAVRSSEKHFGAAVRHWLRW